MTRRLHTWRAVGLAGAVLATAACSPALNWRQITPEQADGFGLQMPCKPDTTVRQVVVPRLGEPAVTMHLLACEADGVQWSVSHFQAGTIERQTLALQALRDALWRNVSDAPHGPTVRHDLGAAEVPGATPQGAARHEWMSGWRPALVQQGQTPQAAQTHTWVFSRGLRVFQATAMADELAENDARVKAFSEGFNFRP